MDIFMEILGYIGSALVLLSFMMTSVGKLRILNASGALVTVVYAIYTQTWPVLLLNAALFVINIVQLIRLKKAKQKE